MTDDGMEEMSQELLLSNIDRHIQLEQERLRLINLELHQYLDTPARYTAYASQLESHISIQHHR